MPSKPPQHPVFSVRLPVELCQRVRLHALVKNKSQAKVVEEILEAALPPLKVSERSSGRRVA